MVGAPHGRSQWQRYPDAAFFIWKGIVCGSQAAKIFSKPVGRLHRPTGPCQARRRAYRFMPMTVSSMVSTVVTPLELAWKPRWVVIICTNSRAMSTLDISI